MDRQREFLALLASGRPFLLDGAMGTALYARGYFINRAFDEANLSDPEKVLAVHRSHIIAGAEVIETNTFSANRFLLGKYGSGDKLKTINLEGVRLARKAVQEARRTVFVAGSVGPTGETVGYMNNEIKDGIRQAFIEQISYLIEGGVDLLLLETFRHLSEIKIALEVARSSFSGAIIAQMSFTEDGTLQDGTNPEQVGTLLCKWGANAIGVNCDGPANVFHIASKMVSTKCAPVIACPNAGQPRLLDSRMMYMATPEYFAVFGKRMLKAGVQGIGGCCGTTDEHLAILAGSVRMLAAGTPEDVHYDSPNRTELELSPISTNLPLPYKSEFATKIKRIWETRLKGGSQRQAPHGPEDFAVSIEVNPAPGLDIRKRISEAKKLKQAGVDVINIADGPRATVRISNTALALAIQKELETEVILHVCCRDRNLLGLQSDILGYHVMGFRNLVIITGDPPKMGDYPKATAVYDLDSIGLLRLVNGLNHGIDPAGKISAGQTQFFLATGAEPGAVDYQRELKRLKQKIEAGAELIMTQPVYDIAVATKFLDDIDSLHTPVLLGLCPLVSSRNAEFLHNEVPGMQIPESIRQRMKAVSPGPAAIAEGIKIAQEMLNALQDRIVGCYIMPQLGQYTSSLKILENLGYNSTII